MLSLKGGGGGAVAGSLIWVPVVCWLLCCAFQNPFYETDQPIRCDKFDSAIEAYVKAITPASLH